MDEKQLKSSGVLLNNVTSMSTRKVFGVLLDAYSMKKKPIFRKIGKKPPWNAIGRVLECDVITSSVQLLVWVTLHSTKDGMQESL